MKSCRVMACVVIWLALAWVTPARADENRAGLVIAFAPDDVHEVCIAFSETSISGTSLLSRAGLGAVSVSEPDGGTSVCRIAEVGCAFPEEECFCQCGDPCLAWHYWVWDGNGWQPYEGSPSERRVGAGDLDAWVWGTAEDIPPDLVSDGPCGAIPALPQSVGNDDTYPEPPDVPPAPDQPYPGEEGTTTVPQPTLTPWPTATPTSAQAPETPGTPTATATPTATPLPPTTTPTLERVELATEAPPPATSEQGGMPDTGATLVVRAATRGAAAPTEAPRPNPDAPVATGRLAAAAGVILAVVLGAAWWRWRGSPPQEPPTA